MDIPANQPLSKDFIDRRNGEKPTWREKARDVAIAVRNDWDELREKEKNKSNPSTQKANSRSWQVPSYKNGSVVKSTGLAMVHKGEKIIPKKSVKVTTKAIKKYAGRK